MNRGVIDDKSLIYYGFIALPVAFAGFPLYVLAPDFYLTRHGLSLTLLGALLLVIRLFDAVQDPLIGWFVDRSKGRFVWLVAAAGGVLSLSIIGLFCHVFLTPAFWFSFCLFFAVSSYSVITIVLGAAATLWTTNPNDQTRIAATREAFGLVGLVVAVSMPTVLSYFVQPDHVYLWYGGILTCLMVLGVMGFSKGVGLAFAPGSVLRGLKNHSVSPLLALKQVPPDSARLFGVYGFTMLASSVPAVLVIFYVRDLLGAEHLTGFFLLIYFLSGVGAMPLWRRMTLLWGKYNTWFLSNMVAVAGFVGAYFLTVGDVWFYGIVCLVSGFALGADLTLPPSILADQIHRRGQSAWAGTYYAFLAFIAKASLALASAIALPLLDGAGFRAGAVNSDDALGMLSVAYALIPCILKLMGAGLLYVFFIRSYLGGNHETS